MQVSSWSLEFYLPWGTRTLQDFQPWRSMDEWHLPSGLAELEQLHVELNTEQSTSLHCSSAHCRWWKAVWGLEMRLGCEPSGLAVLEQLHVKSNREHSWHLRSTLKLTLSSTYICTVAYWMFTIVITTVKVFYCLQDAFNYSRRRYFLFPGVLHNFTREE